MELDKKNKIEKYHFEEIVYILFILSSDLSMYEEDDLLNFAEDIEGTIEVLFKKDYLITLNKKFGFSPEMMSELEDLKFDVINLYESQWFIKLKEKTPQIEEIRFKALQILKKMKIKSDDPLKFSDGHLNIDW
ncbi:MAG: hypothetical protein V4622_03660 [Bacteroidota bacterium]